MALDSKNNIKSVFIIPATPTAAITPGLTITPGSIATGSVVITNMSNEVLATTNTGSKLLHDPAFFDKIKIVKDRGADLPLQQVVLTRDQIMAASSVAGKLAAEQVDYIGYNGASGVMDATINTFFLIKLEHVPNAFAYGKRPANYKYGTYQSAATTTQVEVATGLVKSLIVNFRPNRTTDWKVAVELTNSAASAAITGPTNYTFRRWSKVLILVLTLQL